MENSDSRNFWEKNPGEEFPQIEKLSQMNWEKVGFSWKGKKYAVKSLEYDLKQDENIPDDGRGVLFGLWEVDGVDGQNIPVGFFSGRHVGDEAIFRARENRFKNRDIRGAEFDDLLKMSKNDGTSAVFIDRKYRNISSSYDNKPGNDISYLFHAIVLATLSEMNIQKSLYQVDSTYSVTRSHQYLTNYSELPKTVKFPSFYTKLSNVLFQTSGKGGGLEDTVISTKLTGVQWSMLESAFRK